MGGLAGWLCGWRIDFNSIEFNPVQSQISEFNHDSREALEKLAKLSRQEETSFTRVSIASVVLLTCNYERISFYPFLVRFWAGGGTGKEAGLELHITYFPHAKGMDPGTMFKC